MEGTWSPENGYDYGTEEDVTATLDTLERVLNPMSDRRPSTLIALGCLTDLGSVVRDLALTLATPEQIEVIEGLDRTVFDPAATFDGTRGDSERALEVVGGVGEAADIG